MQDKNTFTNDPYDNARLETFVQHVDKAARNKNDVKNMKTSTLQVYLINFMYIYFNK